FIVADGRREIALAKAPYDVIVVDAILPWTSHAGLLFSTEFYEAGYEKLAKGGLFVEWRPTQRSEAAFMRTFPYGVKIADILLVGSNQAVEFQPDQLVQRLHEPQVETYIKAGGADPAEMYYWITQSPYIVWTPDTPRPATDWNTDLFPKDEYY